MRFTDLPPGARFRFEGVVYVKAGPVTARAEATGALRMIPRYARLKPVQDPGVFAPASSRPETVPTERLLAALARYHAACLAAMEPASEAARARLEDARRRFLEDCGL